MKIRDASERLERLEYTSSSSSLSSSNAVDDQAPARFLEKEKGANQLRRPSQLAVCSLDKRLCQKQKQMLEAQERIEHLEELWIKYAGMVFTIIIFIIIWRWEDD